jgi:hypothetical protein
MKSYIEIASDGTPETTKVILVDEEGKRHEVPCVIEAKFEVSAVSHSLASATFKVLSPKLLIKTEKFKFCMETLDKIPAENIEPA